MNRGEHDRLGSELPVIGRTRAIAPGDPPMRVRRGYVDLFWAENVAGRAGGIRRHVMRVGNGGLVFGMPGATAADRSFGQLAVAGLDCDTEMVPLDELLRDAGTAGLIEAWMVGLGAAVSGHREASRRTLANPGEILELAKDTSICAPPRSLAWLSVTRGRLASDAVTGTTGFGANDGLLPVTETLPATALVPSTVRCLDTAE